MLIGYGRVSTNDQNLLLQKDALENAGCEKIFTDTCSGANVERIGLTQALSQLRTGDVLVVWKLDRLGRSLKHLIETVAELEKKEIGFKSITEGIETQSSGGKLVFHLFASLAEFERDIIKERTKAGLHAAKLRGKVGGRPAVIDSKKLSIAKTMHANPKITVNEICKSINVSRATFYRHMNLKKNTSPSSKII
jgi:DNA invertase Pin-like site-specific DNA recombinase